MKTQRKKSKTMLHTLKELINSYGGPASLTCPSLIAHIQEELARSHRNLTDNQLATARNRMNSLKPKK